jgi:hypothetical protein
VGAGTHRGRAPKEWRTSEEDNGVVNRVNGCRQILDSTAHTGKQGRGRRSGTAVLARVGHGARAQCTPRVCATRTRHLSSSSLVCARTVAWWHGGAAGRAVAVLWRQDQPRVPGSNPDSSSNFKSASIRMDETLNAFFESFLMFLAIFSNAQHCFGMIAADFPSK